MSKGSPFCGARNQYKSDDDDNCYNNNYDTNFDNDNHDDDYDDDNHNYNGDYDYDNDCCCSIITHLYNRLGLRNFFVNTC
jgi:hypothetical protein